MVLTEDHLAIGAVFGAPGSNTALKATTQPVPYVDGPLLARLFAVV
jgi:hypothetical protein